MAKFKLLSVVWDFVTGFERPALYLTAALLVTFLFGGCCGCSCERFVHPPRHAAE